METQRRILSIVSGCALSGLLCAPAARALQDAATPAPSPFPARKELSVEAKKLLPLLETLKGHLDSCIALNLEVDQLKEDYPDETRVGRKKVDEYLEAAVAKADALAACDTSLLVKVVATLKLVSSSDAVKLEAYTYWHGEAVDKALAEKQKSKDAPKAAESPKPQALYFSPVVLEQTPRVSDGV